MTTDNEETPRPRGIPLSEVVNGGTALRDQDPLDGQINTQLYRVTGPRIATRLDLPFLCSLERIQSIAVSDSHVLCLSSLGILYSSGNNASDELGHPSVTQFRPIEKFLKNGVKITQVSAGSYRGIGSHSAAIDTRGRLFMWGRSILCGNVGESTSSASSYSPTIDSPQLVESLQNQNVLQVSCGGAFTLARVVALDSKGLQSTRVYSWGLLASGRMGTGKVASKSETGRGRKKKVPLYQLCPTQIKTLDSENICHVSAGGSHGLAVSANGRVFAWGSNGSGECCIARGVDKNCKGMLDDVWDPRMVHPFGSSTGPMARSAFAGHSTSAVMDADGRLWTWGGGGDNKALLLGHGEGTDHPGEYLVPVADRRGNENMFPISGRSMAKIALLSGCDKVPPFCIPRAVKALQDSAIVKVDMSNSFASAISESKELLVWGTCSDRKMVSGETAIPMPVLQSIHVGSESVVEVASSSAMGLFFVTDGPTIATSLGATLLAQRSQSKLVDCCIITATGKRLGCHSSILACRSTVLKEMVKDRGNKDDQEGGTNVELLLPGIQEETAQALLEYLYTDSVSASQVCTSVLTLRLMEAAERFQLPGLVTICRRCLLDEEDLGMIDFGGLGNAGEYPSTIVRDFAGMLQDPIGGDVSIIARGGEIISAHWSLLTARSSFFREAHHEMTSTPGEAGACALQLSESHETLVRLLHFIYTSEIMGQGNEELVQDLLWAHKYSVQSSKPLIVSSMTITSQNVIEMFELAKRTDTSLLKEKSLHMMSQSSQDLEVLSAETADTLSTWVKERRFLSTIPPGQLKKTMNELQRARKEEAERIEIAEKDLMGVGEGMPVPILLALAAVTATVYVSLQHLEDGGPVVFIANALFIGVGLRYGHKALL